MAPRNWTVSLAIFLIAATLFNLGLSIFFLLYNLYLLDRGFQESFLGLMTGIQTAGSICGSLPAGWLATRFGVGTSLRLAFAGAAVVCAPRAAVVGWMELLALAFLGGLVSALWAVTVAPALAQLSPEKSRPRAFSLFSALGIATGALAGFAGGQLPEWIRRWNPGSQDPKQMAIWIGCVLPLLALVPTFRLRFEQKPLAGRGSVPYPRTSFIKRFLAAAAVWNLFVGAFPPFFNAYFSRRFGAGTARIGLIFSGSQMAQVAAMLLAPALFARVGLIRGIPATQIAAAAALALLAPASGVVPAAIAYSGYMALQWMSEPGWLSLLMNRVSPEQRSSASALNFFVVFTAQAVAAALFGATVARLGYPAALLATAALGLVSAVVFLRLLATPWSYSR